MVTIDAKYASHLVYISFFSVLGAASQGEITVFSSVVGKEIPPTLLARLHPISQDPTTERGLFEFSQLLRARPTLPDSTRIRLAP